MKRILVVDDEIDIQMLFEQQFEDEINDGILKFMFAYNGEEALTFLKSHDDIRSILILSDINMPGMTGLELLKIIKTEMPDCKVAIVSAYGDAANREKAIKYKADDFITKPIDFSYVKQLILNSIQESDASEQGK